MIETQSRIGGGRLRTLGWLVAGALIIGLLIDAGAVVLTMMRVDDDVKSAGFAAATAIENQPVSPAAAQAAYAAAEVGLDRSETIEKDSFVVQADGGVTLTMTREAPSLLFKHVGFLSDYVSVSKTYDQPKVGF